MKTKRAKIFICHHPAGLLLYKNLIKIIKKYDSEAKIILFKVNHPYFAELDFEPYKKYYDEIREFQFINYKKNFLKGFWEILNFQKKLKNTTLNLLANFERIDLFLDVSAWLPVNILLYNLSREENVKSITKFNLALGSSHVKIDKIKTFLCALYTLPFRCYQVKVLSTLGGKFLNFAYIDNTPGTIFKIISPMAKELNNPNYYKKENILPCPVVPEGLPAEKKDMVIVFGKKNIFQSFSEYLPNYEIYVKKLVALFRAIADKYLDCKLYYKPHPADQSELMPGIDNKRYELFDNTINTQALFDKYYNKIKAVYAFSSNSVIWGSFLGIPSYTFYKYLCNQNGINKFNNYFNQDNMVSEFLYHIADLREIGRVDHLNPPLIDSRKIEEVYRKALKL